MNFKLSLKRPVYIVANAWAPLVSTFGMSRLKRMEDRLNQTYGPENVIAFNVFNTNTSSIEERARRIKNNLLESLDKRGIEEVDLIGVGVSGVDCRFCLSFHELNPRIKNVVTIGSPHFGSFIADMVNQGKIPTRDLIPAFQSLGLDYKDLSELNTSNMRDFNDYMTSFETNNVFSINGDLSLSSVSPVLKNIAQHFRRLQERINNPGDNDGLFLAGETSLFDESHLLTFDADAIELAGVAKRENDRQLLFAADFLASKIDA